MLLAVPPSRRCSHQWLFMTLLLLVTVVLLVHHPTSAFVVVVVGKQAAQRSAAHTQHQHQRFRASATTPLLMTSEKDRAQPPSTFREAEVLGLKYMQEGNYEQALKAFQKGMELPGSRSDVVRTKLLSGPSPVGGSFSGTDSQVVLSLDEFELQAAYYNMACAHAGVGNKSESIESLRQAFENGFDNYNTVLSDPDLDAIKGEEDFQKLMDEYNNDDDQKKKGGLFNPFGLFGKKK